FISYITRYMGGSIQLFDLFVIDPIRRNKELGAETFSGIYEMLAKLGFDNNIIKGLEWRVSPNYYSLGNVYTAIRRYYSDFGVIGIVICQS
ncbi:oligosaccharide repeat unit polymerase, partial [Streptococcus pneumoniae]|nr:oligosaccharide repeat unit polymerase [Streptococcus pneumoniae]